MTISAETQAWLQQSARAGSTSSQVFLHLLEEVRRLDSDDLEQAESNRVCSEAIVRRLELLEKAQQPRQDKLDRLIEQDREDDDPQTLHTIALKMVDTLKQLGVLPEILDTLRRAIREPMQRPTPEVAPVATDEELWEFWCAEGMNFVPDVLRACYELGRKHGAAQARCPHIRSSDEGTSYCGLAEQTAAAQSTSPAALSDALSKAESALSDIAEGEETNAAPNTFEWAERRCADALAIIRPVMRLHGIRTSEWPGCCFNPPQPTPPAAPAGGLVERVAGQIAGFHDELADEWIIEARAAIREVAGWLDQRGQHGCSLWLREEADRG